MDRGKFLPYAALGGVIVTSLIASGCSAPSTGATKTQGTSVASPAMPPASEFSAESSQGTAGKAPDLTTSQQNAVESAQSYLEFGSFSRSGLIDQLKFEGFSKADATTAVDSLNVDWNEQAAKSAASYLESSSFSRAGLVDQLKFEGFTSSQAEYGVDAAFGGSGGDNANGGGGGGDSVSRQNAVESATSYLQYSSFSRDGLIDQLQFEGYSKSDATYAVDSLNVDWNEQAAKSAQSYLDTSSFSRSGLIDQLMFEGFSRSQAEYGVSAVGL